MWVDVLVICDIKDIPSSPIPSETMGNIADIDDDTKANIFSNMSCVQQGVPIPFNLPQDSWLSH